jgi:hypothetical protein
MIESAIASIVQAAAEGALFAACGVSTRPTTLLDQFRPP